MKVIYAKGKYGSIIPNIENVPFGRRRLLALLLDESSYTVNDVLA